MELVKSKNNVLIRLSDERWSHITEEHCELVGLLHDVLDTIKNPKKILEGKQNAQLAVGQMSDGKYIVVIYRELNGDGFVMTAFLTRKMQYLNRRKQLWP